MSQFVRPHPPSSPTPNQNIALALVFEVMGEEQMNRGYEEYMAIAARLPPLKALLPLVNKRLCEWDRTHGHLLPQICRFRIGDQRIIYEPYPKKISIETLRLALNRSGMREPRRETRK